MALECSDDEWSSSEEDEQAVDNATLEAGWWDALFARAEAATAEAAGGDGDASIEWLLSYHSSGRFFTPWLPRDPARKALLIGVGNSSFPVELHADGWCPNMVASDFSPVVVRYMQERYKLQWETYRGQLAEFGEGTGGGSGGGGDGKAPKRGKKKSAIAAKATAVSVTCATSVRALPITWEVQDARALSYATGSAAVVLDKSLIDCMWYAEEQLRTPALCAVVAEAARVLVADGTGVALFMTQRAPGAMGPLLCGESENHGGGGDVSKRWSSVEFLELCAGCEALTGNLGKESEVVLASEAAACFGIEKSEDEESEGAKRTETLFLYICRRAAADTDSEAVVAPVPVPDQSQFKVFPDGGGLKEEEKKGQKEDRSKKKETAEKMVKKKTAGANKRKRLLT